MLNARNILVDFHCISSCPVAVKFFSVPGERVLVQTLRFKRDKSAQTRHLLEVSLFLACGPHSF